MGAMKVLDFYTMQTVAEIDSIIVDRLLAIEL